MNELIARISESESVVMRAFWEAARELTITELATALADAQHWDRSTIKTMVRRLQEKGVLVCIQRDVQHFRPAVSEDQYRAYHTRKLVSTLYHDSASKLVASLYEQRKLTPEDIRVLRQLLDEGERHG